MIIVLLFPEVLDKSNIYEYFFGFEKDFVNWLDSSEIDYQLQLSDDVRGFGGCRYEKRIQIFIDDEKSIALIRLRFGSDLIYYENGHCYYFNLNTKL